MYLRIAIFLFPILLGSCDRRPSERFVKINGKDQHILDVGSGEPVVVFVSGFGNDLGTYAPIQRAVSGFTRAISYDRAGVGKSELTVPDGSLDIMVDELNRILEQESIPGPYVLVGHSSGGHIVRYFAHIYPAKVAGMVLIDPTPEYMDDEIRRLKTPAEIRSYDSLNEHGRNPSWSEGLKREADYFNVNELTIKKSRFPNQIPITVLTAMNMRESRHSFLKGVNQIKFYLHKKWLKDAPHIRHVLAHRSGHYIHIDEPELVISEIRTMVKK